MSALADKLIWVKENLPGLVEEDGEVTKGSNKIKTQNIRPRLFYEVCSVF